MLKTLIEQGWAYRRVNDGSYCLAKAPGGRNPNALARARIARKGAPHLQALSAATGLAADLAIVVEAGVLEVIESTRTRTEGGVDPIVVGFRPSLVFSAPGRMVLAASDPPLRQAHLEHLLRGDSPRERYYVSSGALAEEIKQSLKRGYARREKGYWPAGSVHGEEPMDIAVAFGPAGAPLGSLSIVWPAAQQSAEAVATAHLQELTATAEALTAILGKLEGPSFQAQRV